MDPLQINLVMRVITKWVHFKLLENLNFASKQNSIFYYNNYDREYDEKGTIDKYKSEVIGLKYDASKTINSNILWELEQNINTIGGILITMVLMKHLLKDTQITYLTTEI